MGVAGIPQRKDQRTCHELRPQGRKMDVAKGTTEEFVTVVSVGSQPTTTENFVTVLSIGNGKKDDEVAATTACKSLTNGADGYLEEEVEVYRLPGERLGFGLKFEGGNKTSERVRRLFVQSCAEQSPASRAKCSWGTLGEGDEVLSIDGIPVTHMTRLDCVRRLKESQLVIRLMVRCRGALRPEVVSAERKMSTERSKVPPELPAAPPPPPVPPRKLRQPRGSADGEANPGPVRKSWDTSPRLRNGTQCAVIKASAYENCELSSPKGSPKDRSPELAKAKQEPLEAMVYLDARSQCGSAHDSTSDDTGSSMSTVIDRFSTSDRVSTVSTTSTASNASEQQQQQQQQQQQLCELDRDVVDRPCDRDALLSRAVCPLERLERDFSAHPPENYLLRRLASSEAMTYVESRGDVERITAVVAPNTVLIEETITLQPPLSFQDAPLSYGHEARPDLLYTAGHDSSAAHFRPIKDDVELVERVNGRDEFRDANCVSGSAESRTDKRTSSSPPPLPARNHVNRICVNETTGETPLVSEARRLPTIVSPERELPDVPLLPPKPLPRKDVKARRKRPPPPPPPPPPPLPSPITAPRTDAKGTTTQSSFESNSARENCGDPPLIENAERVRSKSRGDSSPSAGGTVRDGKNQGIEESNRFDAMLESTTERIVDNEIGAADAAAPSGTGDERTNKIFEIIEIRMAKSSEVQKESEGVTKTESADSTAANSRNERTIVAERDGIEDEATGSGEQQTRLRFSSNASRIPTDDRPVDGTDDEKERGDETRMNNQDAATEAFPANGEDSTIDYNPAPREGEDDEKTYRSLDEVNDDAKNLEVNRMLEDEEIMEEEEEEDTTDESDDGDYYWQSNLATIGEEEETSLEYADANTDAEVPDRPEQERSPHAAKKDDAFVRNDTVNGKMENCGGGQRLPPDGDEFPAAYQEFGGGGNNGQPYRYIAATRTTTTTITTNGGGGLCNSENEPFRGGESFQMLANDSNVVVGSRSVALSDGKMMTLTSGENAPRQDIGSKVKTSIENIRSEMGNAAVATNIDSVRQEVSNEERKPSYQTAEDAVARSKGGSLYPCQTSNGNLLTNEKKTEIAAYYHKDATTIEELVVPSHRSEKDTPPPLPLTGPPKMEQVVSHARNVPPPSATDSPQRKFSLNGDLWRQDDKSERSVRDKIAMFSSQSSLDAPLFPSAVTAAAAATCNSNSSSSRRISKYKSSEDVCCDERGHDSPRERPSFFVDRTQSSLDLTDSSSARTPSSIHDPARKYNQRAPANLSPQTACGPSVVSSPSGGSPSVVQRNAPKITLTGSTYDKQPMVATTRNYCAITTVPENNGTQNIAYPTKGASSCTTTNVGNNPAKTSTLTRATSFSGSTPAAYAQDGGTLTIEPTTMTTTHGGGGTPPISRASSLASTFRRPGEDARRNSLNQLIEQRRRSISKLRGLVIPEKDPVPIDQPIVDLPEIKSRDSILLQQVTKATNIQDKWGSQSSLASNTSTASMPPRATTSFKMPAPQIHSKYSPAFKRKSLTVYGMSMTSHSPLNGGGSPTKNSQSSPGAATPSAFSEPPKSLESICSPTRSDYSFEFASTTSSPDGSQRARLPRTTQGKARLDYDDSDNDSAVSSSQSSMSRGFSPPMSPVPSERSTISSSERSYVSNTELNYHQRRSLIADGPARDMRDTTVGVNKDQYGGRVSALVGGERTYLTERSSSSSSGSNPRSPLPTTNELISSRSSSQIPQRQQLRRSNSTDTNCSTSSTLTSGSQASAESLSRRVLKPQSVEAINRKNILASARCRSGRDLNGSPLIQRKFSDDEDAATRVIENGGVVRHTVNNTRTNPACKQEIKIAYIEVAEPAAEGSFPKKGEEEEPKLPPKRSVPPPPCARPPKCEMLEPSNDLKMWVRAEVKSLARAAAAEEKSSSVKYKEKSSPDAAPDSETSPVIRVTRDNRGAANFNEPVGTPNGGLSTTRSRIATEETKIPMMEMSKVQQPGRATAGSSSNRKNMEDQNDLLTILTTKSRSRSAIHVDEGTFGRTSKNHMSLEDILGARADAKLLRAQSVEPKIERNGGGGKAITGSQTKSGWESRDNRYGVGRRVSATSSDSWSEDRPFVSKIPTLGRARTVDSGDETSENVERTKGAISSKIPTCRGLNRRSVSVTDMKKALERIDASCPTAHGGQQNATACNHNRFSSLDSSVDENVGVGTETDTDRCYGGEQFGSISSLASSTSLISQQELAQLVEEASLEEARGAHDVVVVLLHKENPTGSVGITLAGGADCEVKEITVHRVLTHSIADKDGRVQRGDRILSINGRSTRGLTHRESMAVLKQPRSEIVLVVSRARLMEEGCCKLRSRTASVETIVEGLETNGSAENTAWGPPSTVAVYKGGAGLGFSLEGGRDSPLGDRPLIIKKIFTGGAAEKTGALRAGDQLLEVNGNDVTRMSRIEAWSLMKKLHDGEVNLLVRRPATKSS